MSTKLKACDYAKRLIIEKAVDWYDDFKLDESLDNAESINKYFKYIFDNDMQWDLTYEVSFGQHFTNIMPKYSRHYESRSVAAKVDDVWIGWTHWYGGGKHGEPESIDWWQEDEVYFLEVKEKEVKIIERSWEKK